MNPIRLFRPSDYVASFAAPVLRGIGQSGRHLYAVILLLRESVGFPFQSSKSNPGQLTADRVGRRFAASPTLADSVAASNAPHFAIDEVAA